MPQTPAKKKKYEDYEISDAASAIARYYEIKEKAKKEPAYRKLLEAELDKRAKAANAAQDTMESMTSET
jgi:hypothetical protein